MLFYFTFNGASCPSFLFPLQPLILLLLAHTTLCGHSNVKPFVSWIPFTCCFIWVNSFLYPLIVCHATLSYLPYCPQLSLLLKEMRIYYAACILCIWHMLSLLLLFFYMFCKPSFSSDNLIEFMPFIPFPVPSHSLLTSPMYIPCLFTHLDFLMHSSSSPWSLFWCPRVWISSLSIDNSISGMPFQYLLLAVCIPFPFV